MLAFFGDGSVRQAIDTLAAARELTVVAGAGSSMEIGLPSWENLVLALLDEVIARRGWSDDAPSFHAIGRQNGLLTTAAMIEALLGTSEMSAAIKRHLYGGADPGALRPGPLARAIAALQHDFGRTMRLATTNYDDVLELALRERPAGARWWTAVRSAVNPSSVSDDTVTVTHLHGLLGRRDAGRIVLSEGDYQRMQLHRSWQEAWMVEALSSTTCLFVGASMTDANLIRYLYRAGGGGRGGRHPHVALFRRRPAETEDELRFRGRAEEAERARWTRLGIVPLFADNFADIAQFVEEVADRRRSGRDGYVPLPDRLAAWFADESQTGCLYRVEDEGYQEVQELLHQALRRLTADARRLLLSLGVDLSAEKLAVALLSLYPPESAGQPERVIVLASSDRIMTSVESIAPIPLRDRSEWTGVKVICRGVPLGEEKDVYASRWRYVLAFPVYTDEPRTPLGAVTLASMSAPSGLELDRLPASVRSALAELMAGSARNLLTLGSRPAVAATPHDVTAPRTAGRPRAG